MVAVPLLRPIGLPLVILDEVRDTLALIASFPEGSVVWLASEVAATNAAELRPMITAFARYLVMQNHRIIIGGFWTDGCNLARIWLDPIFEEMGAVYGVNYVNLGYRPSSTSVLDECRKDIINAYSDRDIAGRKLSEMPVMAGVTKASDIDYLVCMSPGTPGTSTYISAWRATGEVDVIIDCPTSGMYTTAGNNYQAGITKGLVGGLNGSAQVEQLIGYPGKAIRGMDAQGTGHFAILLYLIIGNIGYYQIRRMDREAKEHAGG